MQKLAEQHWAAGMTLAKPVENDKGMVLAASGTELSGRMIELFKTRGVESIVVEGHPVEIEGQERKPLEERLQELDRAFIRVEGDRFMTRLKGMCQTALEELERRDQEETREQEEEADADAN